MVYGDRQSEQRNNDRFFEYVYYLSFYIQECQLGLINYGRRK